MALRPRDQGTGSLGLRPGKPRDLIGDIQAQQRRKLLRRAAGMAAFAAVVILVAVVVKSIADRRSLDAHVTAARGRFSLGTAADLGQAEATLEEGLEDFPEEPQLLGALALVRAQRVAEYGMGLEAAETAVADCAALETYDAELARGLTAVAQGDFGVAESALEELEGLDESESIAPGHGFWLEGQLALAAPMRVGGPAAVADIEQELRTHVASGEGDVAVQRLYIALLMSQGKGREALEELERARGQSATHEGLAADEALYNAVLRQKLGGVASVSEQLLEHADDLSPPDRAHARIARAVVHLYSGERERALELANLAWPDLTGGDRVARTLALELAMEAGAAEQALEWVKSSSLPEPEPAIYRAWARLVNADVMAALTDTAELPQAHPRVAYIQGLALTEQGRWKEAKPWLDRADRMIPGRVDIEVALARVDAHVGDPRLARRKLEGLAKEEPFAPRAWTGLGEAYLQLYDLAVAQRAKAAESEEEPAPEEDLGDPRDLLAEAEAALARAVEVERRPAEAHLLSAQVWKLRAHERTDGYTEALARFEAAAEANPKLPRYREELALYLAYMGHRSRAIALLRELIDEVGITYRVPLTLARLEANRAEALDVPVPDDLGELVDQAEKLGAAEGELVRARALIELVRGDREGLEAAKASLSAYLDAHDDDIDAHALLGRVVLRQRESKEALGLVRRALAGVPEPQKGRLEFVRGFIEYRKGKYPPAAMFTRTGFNLMLAENRPPAELLDAAEVVIDAYVRARKPKPGLTVARDLAERLPYHPRSWTIRATVQLASKRTSDALESAEKAAELDPDDPEAHALIGNVWLRFGKKDNAREAYQKAVDLTEGTSLEATYRENLRRL